MNILGWFLCAVGLVGVIFGILQMLKAKKMQTVPYRKPSEILQMGPSAADAKGLVSSEGQVQPGPLQLVAPMSGQPCLAYEITIERKWEKMVMTEKGQQKKTGSAKVHGETRGAVFVLTDGVGQLIVDATAELDADMEKGHSSTVQIGAMIPGTLQFGQMQMHTPHSHDDTRTTAYVGTEKLVKPSATLFALGALSPGQYGLSIHTPKGMGTGKLILSHHGREKLLGKTKRNMILGYVLGALLSVGGAVLGILGPKAQSTGCPDTLAGAVTCEDHMHSNAGKNYDLKITDAGSYRVIISHPHLAFPVFPVVEVKDSSGNLLGKAVSNSPEEPATLDAALSAGTYKIHVADRDDLTEKIEGGFTIHVAVQKMSADAPAASGSAVASGSPSASGSTQPAASSAKSAGATPAKTKPVAPVALPKKKK